MRSELAVEEQTIAALARPLLERQRDQIAETALRKRVLVWKEPIVGVESDLRAPLHRLGQDVSAEFARERRWNRLLEKEPNMPTAARTRAFERGVETQLAAGLEKRSGVIAPPGLVEINGEKEAGFVEEQRINPGDEWLTTLIVAG